MNQEKKKIKKVIEELTLFDDELMRRVFDENIEATQLVLQIILRRKIKVIRVVGQETFNNAKVGGRNIVLDVHAIDIDGRHIDIEVQGDANGAIAKRARYHSSVVDARMLKEKEPFKHLKDSYIIFIYKHDKFKRGQPVYHIERVVKETGEAFRDGSYIIYLNGSYKGNDAIGKLIEDFHQTDYKKMHYGPLSKSVQHCKESEEGSDDMSGVVERYAKEYAKEYAADEKVISVQNMLKNTNFTLEQALNILEIHGRERKYIIDRIQKSEDKCHN